ncbi:hypothetical protein COL154_011592 [Colletotrichum chrysophilum]|nr:hypothetical protein COL154_011592 [Colletotrichum chrysophilum]
MTGNKQKEPFWLGGAAASMAVCFRIFSLWSGLSASIFRQTTYSTARFGLYNYFAQSAKQYTGKEKLSTAMTITCAGLAGGMAGLVGNPAEVSSCEYE